MTRAPHWSSILLAFLWLAGVCTGNITAPHTTQHLKRLIVDHLQVEGLKYHETCGENATADRPIESLVKIREFLEMSAAELKTKYGDVESATEYIAALLNDTHQMCRVLMTNVCMGGVCVTCWRTKEDGEWRRNLPPNVKMICAEAWKLEEYQEKNLALVPEELVEWRAVAQEVFNGGEKKEGGSCKSDANELDGELLDLEELLGKEEKEIHWSKNVLPGLKKVQSDRGFCSMRENLVCSAGGFESGKCVSCKKKATQRGCEWLKWIPGVKESSAGNIGAPAILCLLVFVLSLFQAVSAFL